MGPSARLHFVHLVNIEEWFPIYPHKEKGLLSLQLSWISRGLPVLFHSNRKRYGSLGELLLSRSREFEMTIIHAVLV